jgi:hypothetical protein
MEVWLLLGMTQPGRLGRNSKLETGQTEFESGNWKLDTALGFEFPVSSFAFSLAITPRSGKKMGGIKKITDKPDKLLKTKDRRTN